MGKRSREKEERRFQSSDASKPSTKINKSSWERVCFLFVECGTYLALFAPLIVIRSFFFPFVSPKTIFFRIVVEIVFVFYILLVLNNRKYLPKMNVLFATIIIFFLVFILTSFTGIDFHKSFWSTFERMTGILTFFHLLAFFIILAGTFKERKYWERILTVSIVVGIIIGLYVLFFDKVSDRGGGTLGNTSFMSAYLLFDIFFAIILFFVKKGFWKILYGGAFILFSAAIFFNVEPTRGAIGALLISIFILILSYMVFSGEKLLKKLAPVFLILGVLVVIGITQTSFFKTKVMDVKELPGVSRTMVWKAALDAWKEKPLLGWGPENFSTAFTKYFNPGLFLTTDIWYDRVHNVVLDTLVASGIVGLLSYLAIWVVAIWGLLRICSKVTAKRNLLFPLGMIALLAAYFLQNIWVFDMISTYMMLFLSLAFIYFLLKEEKEGDGPPPEKNQTLSAFGIVLIVLTIIVFYFGNVQSIRASLNIIQGIISTDLNKSIASFEKAMKDSPMATYEAPEQFSRKMTGYADTSQNKELLIKGLEASAEALKKSIANNPEEFRTWLMLGNHYNDFYNLTSDPQKLNQAEGALEEAIKLSPKNLQGYWGLAQTKISMGKSEEAVDLLKKAVELEPRLGRSHWYLFLAYALMGKFDLAAEKASDAEKSGFNWKESIDNIQKVIEVYQNLQNDKELVSLYLLAIEKNPKEARYRIGLGVAYANLGQFEEARKAAGEALRLTNDPAFISEIERFLQQLPK